MLREGRYFLKSTDITITPTDEKNLWDCEWVIASRKDGNKQIGTVSFMGDKGRGAVPIHIMLEERYQNRGIGTEVLKMMVDWAFLHRNVYEVTAVCEHENDKAVKSLEKAGFVYRDHNKLDKIEHYSIKKQPSSWTGLYLMIGIVVGLILGIVLNMPWVGLGLGLVVSLLIGAIMDNNEEKDRERITGEKRK